MANTPHAGNPNDNTIDINLGGDASTQVLALAANVDHLAHNLGTVLTQLDRLGQPKAEFRAIEATVAGLSAAFLELNRMMGVVDNGAKMSSNLQKALLSATEVAQAAQAQSNRATAYKNEAKGARDKVYNEATNLDPKLLKQDLKRVTEQELVVRASAHENALLLATTQENKQAQKKHQKRLQMIRDEQERRVIEIKAEKAARVETERVSKMYTTVGGRDKYTTEMARNRTMSPRLSTNEALAQTLETKVLNQEAKVQRDDSAAAKQKRINDMLTSGKATKTTDLNAYKQMSVEAFGAAKSRLEAQIGAVSHLSAQATLTNDLAKAEKLNSVLLALKHEMQIVDKKLAERLKAVQFTDKTLNPTINQINAKDLQNPLALARHNLDLKARKTQAEQAHEYYRNAGGSFANTEAATRYLAILVAIEAEQNRIKANLSSTKLGESRQERLMFLEARAANTPNYGRNQVTAQVAMSSIQSDIAKGRSLAADFKESGSIRDLKETEKHLAVLIAQYEKAKQKRDAFERRDGANQRMSPESLRASPKEWQHVPDTTLSLGSIPKLNQDRDNILANINKARVVRLAALKEGNEKERVEMDVLIRALGRENAKISAELDRINKRREAANFDHDGARKVNHMLRFNDPDSQQKQQLDTENQLKLAKRLYPHIAAQADQAEMAASIRILQEKMAAFKALNKATPTIQDHSAANSHVKQTLQESGRLDLPAIRGMAGVQLLREELLLTEALRMAKAKLTREILTGNEAEKEGNNQTVLALKARLGLVQDELKARTPKAPSTYNAGHQWQNRVNTMMTDQGQGSLLLIQTSLQKNYMLLNGFKSLLSGSYSFIKDFESSLLQTQAITQSTVTQMESLRESINSVANGTKFSSVEIAQAATVLAQAGFSMREVENSLRSVTLLATATGSSLANTVDITTSVLGAFQLSTDRLPQIVNQITQAMNMSKLDINKFQQAIQYAGNAAADAGLSFKETLASIATVSNTGIRSGSTMGTGFRQLLADLQAPSKEFIAIMERYGITMDDINVNTQGFAGVLENLKEKGFSTADAFASFEVRAVAYYTAMKNNLSLDGTLKAGMDSSTAATEANAIQMQSLEAQTARVKNQFFTMMSEGLKPATEALAGFFAIAADVFHMLSTVASNGAVQFVVLTAAITATVLVVKNLGQTLAAAWYAYKVFLSQRLLDSKAMADAAAIEAEAKLVAARATTIAAEALALETAALRANTVATEMNVAATELGIEATVVDTAVTNANSAATEVNTVATTQNAASNRAAAASMVRGNLVIIALIATLTALAYAYNRSNEEAKKINETLERSKTRFNEAKDAMATTEVALGEVDKSMAKVLASMERLAENPTELSAAFDDLQPKLIQYGLSFERNLTDKVEDLIKTYQRLRVEVAKKLVIDTTEAQSALKSKILATQINDRVKYGNDQKLENTQGHDDAGILQKMWSSGSTMDQGNFYVKPSSFAWDRLSTSQGKPDLGRMSTSQDERIRRLQDRIGYDEKALYLRLKTAMFDQKNDGKTRDDFELPRVGRFTDSYQWLRENYNNPNFLDKDHATANKAKIDSLSSDFNYVRDARQTTLADLLQNKDENIRKVAEAEQLTWSKMGEVIQAQSERVAQMINLNNQTKLLESQVAVATATVVTPLSTAKGKKARSKAQTTEAQSEMMRGLNLEALSREYNVPMNLALAVSQAESGWNPKALSPVGAEGLFQFMPATAERFADKDPLTGKKLPVDRKDPNQSARMFYRYMSWLINRYKGDETKAIAAYNAGEGNVDKYGGIPPFRETKDYVARVQALYSERNKGTYDPYKKVDLQTKTSIGAKRTKAESIGTEAMDEDDLGQNLLDAIAKVEETKKELEKAKKAAGQTKTGTPEDVKAVALVKVLEGNLSTLMTQANQYASTVNTVVEHNDKEEAKRADITIAGLNKELKTLESRFTKAKTRGDWLLQAEIRQQQQVKLAARFQAQNAKADVSTRKGNAAQGQYMFNVSDRTLSKLQAQSDFDTAQIAINDTDEADIAVRNRALSSAMDANNQRQFDAKLRVIDSGFKAQTKDYKDTDGLNSRLDELLKIKSQMEKGENRGKFTEFDKQVMEEKIIEAQRQINLLQDRKGKIYMDQLASSEIHLKDILSGLEEDQTLAEHILNSFDPLDVNTQASMADANTRLSAINSRIADVEKSLETNREASKGAGDVVSANTTAVTPKALTSREAMHRWAGAGLDELSSATHKLTNLQDLATSTGDSFSQLFKDLTQGSGDTADAFENFGKRFIQTLGEMLLKELAFRAVMGIVSAFTGTPSDTVTLGMEGGGSISNTALASWEPMARGGFVTGGIQNHDSVPTMLMPDEFVMPKTTTDILGPEFLEGLRKNPAQTVEGLKGAKLMNATQSSPVNVWLVSPDQKPAGLTDRDVVQIISDDIQRNGTMRKLIKQVGR